MSFGENIGDLVQGSTNGLLGAHSSWERVKAGEIASLLNGYAFKSEWFSDHEGTPIVRIRDIVAGHAGTFYRGPADDPKMTYIENGQIAIGMDGDFNSKLWNGGRALLNQRVCTLRADDRFYSQKFLSLVLPGYLGTINNHTSSVTVKHLSSRTVLDTPLPLPPLNEQHRIVEKIEMLFARLDQGEAALRKVQTLLARYRQSVLKAAITGQLTADWHEHGGSHGWKRTTLGALAKYVTSGSRGWAEFYSDSGDLFIRAQNLKRDRLELDDIAHVALRSNSEGTRARVRKGDLLITITGANVTKSALVERELGTAYVSQHVALFRPTEEVDPEFLYWFVIAEAGGRRQLETYAYGAGKPGLNLQNIRDVRLSLPPLEEQREIAQRIRASISLQEAVLYEVSRELQASIALRKSILRDALAGRLVPQDPNDEPAAELLARIHEAREGAPKKTARKKANV